MGERKFTRVARCREGAFDKVSEESAYWAGFLMADGCVMQVRHYQPVIALGLSAKDEEHVRRFREFIATPNPVSYSNSSGHGGSRIAQVKVSSDRLAAGLARFGVTPRKQGRECVIALENNRHFWRGMVDGDGCIALYGQAAWLVLVGSRQILEQFREYILTIVPTFYGSVHKDREKNLHRLTLAHRTARRVVSELYDGCTVALPRKKAVAEKMAAWVPVQGLGQFQPGHHNEARWKRHKWCAAR